METETKVSVSMNKLAVIYVLAGLIQKPLLFADNTYNFSIEDFPEQFHQIVFAAVEHLAKSGMEKIDYIDIDRFLKPYTVQYNVFVTNRGIEYIQNALAMYDEKKFDYYYDTLKKHSLINKLEKSGIDTKDIYDPEIIDPIASAKMQAAFDNMTINDILLQEETKVILLKEEFGSNSDRVENHAGDGLRALKERLKKTPDIGLPLISPKLTTVLRGQRFGALFMESAPAGFGKAITNETKIPTPLGWRTVGDIKPGDCLFDALGKPTKVLEIFPQGKKEVWRVTFADGRYVDCCNEHLWSFYTTGQKPRSRQNRKFFTKTLQEIIDDYPLYDKEGQMKLSVPRAYAVEYPEKKHYLTPYVMGALLGDGSFRISQKNNVLYYSSEDTYIPEMIATEMGWHNVKCKHGYSYKFEQSENKSIGTHFNVWVQDALKEYPELIHTKSQTKFIPREYLEDSIANRWALLQGLMDTDGTVDVSQGEVSYTTTSPRLKEDFQELARSLGFITSVYEDTHKTTSVCYLIRLAGDPELKSKLFRLPKKSTKIKTWLDNNNYKRKYPGVKIANIEKLHEKKEMTCFLVDNPEHLFLVGDFIVTHNSRRQNGEACHLAVPEYYNVNEGKWIKTNLQESVLMISTELEEFECQQMWMAYVSGVSETHIKDGRYAPGEEERVDRAIELIEKSNLYFVSVTNFDAADIINTIKKYKQLHGIKYFYFDYLGENSKIASAFSKTVKMQGLRTDQVLLDFSSRLKDTCKTLGIFGYTSSQLSGDYKNAKDLDASFLRSAKSLADKIDAGWILMPIREQDQSVISAYCAKGFELQPNFVWNIYKVRAGSYQNIKLYFYFDRSTCQCYDCFCTDSQGNLLAIEDTDIEIVLDDTKEEDFGTAYTGGSVSTDTSDVEFDF